MNIYEIFRVREEDPALFRDFGFSSLDLILQRHPECRPEAEDAPPMLPREAWKFVYTFVTEKEPSLDWIYSRFQHGAGRAGFLADQRARETERNYTGRSLSVSDVVKTPDGRLWFCDSFGWKEIRWRSN